MACFFLVLLDLLDGLAEFASTASEEIFGGDIKKCWLGKEQQLFVLTFALLPAYSLYAVKLT